MVFFVEEIWWSTINFAPPSTYEFAILSSNLYGMQSGLLDLTFLAIFWT